MQPLDAALLGALALPLFAAHNLADHPLQSSAWAAAKGQCTHEGRLACTKHVAVVVLLQAVAVLGVIVLTDTAVSPVAVVVGLAFTGWSHWWFDRRFTAAGLYQALGKTSFAKLGTPRPGHDDAPHLGTGAYRMDQDWHILWLALSGLIIASSGLILTVLASLATMLMISAIVASRIGRRALDQ